MVRNRTFAQLVNPLRDIYGRRHRALPALAPVLAEAVPEPYHGLLVHTRDMTPTLEAFHRAVLRLQVLARYQDEGSLSRMVVLESAAEPHQPVEFGAIKIHLTAFSLAAREQILACRVPLGTILQTMQIVHTCRPAQYLRVDADATIVEALQMKRAQPLFGRFNTLYDRGNRLLAEVVEILPPADEGEQAP